MTWVTRRDVVFVFAQAIYADDARNFRGTPNEIVVNVQPFNRADYLKPLLNTAKK